MSIGEEVENSDIGRRLVTGSAWMLAMRWSSRLMGLASMVVVARLLTPSDFGIYAVATAFIGLLDAFTDAGTDIALIRHENPQRRHYDTAWTFKILLHGTSAGLIALAAPIALYVYGDERYQAILLVLATSILIAGFANPGIADFRRDLRFRKDFQYNILIQVAGVLATVAFALLLHSYWALVLGGLVRSVTAVALSYWMHAYRPRLSLAARSEMFDFSIWVMVRSVAIFLTSSGDWVIVGAFFPTQVTGWYSIACSLATMAVFELLHPIGRALLPGLAAKQGDSQWEARNLKTIFGGTATIAAAAALGLSALATPVVTLLYGQQYAEAGPMLAILALSAGIGGFNQPVGQYLTVTGRVRALAIIFGLEGLATIVVTYLLASKGATMQSIVLGRLVIATIAFTRLGFLLREVHSIGWHDVARAWLRPFVAGAVMYTALSAAQRFVSPSPLEAVLWGVPLGAAVYAAILFSSWKVMGCPPGIESELLERLGAGGTLGSR